MLCCYEFLKPQNYCQFFKPTKTATIFLSIKIGKWGKSSSNALRGRQKLQQSLKHALHKEQREESEQQSIGCLLLIAVGMGFGNHLVAHHI